MEYKTTEQIYTNNEIIRLEIGDGEYLNALIAAMGTGELQDLDEFIARVYEIDLSGRDEQEDE